MLKRYPAVLFSDVHAAAERCARIEEFTAARPNVPPVRFIFGDGWVERRTLVVPDACRAKWVDFRRLEELVGEMHSCGIVHGDIAPRNIIVSPSGWFLTDFEPSLSLVTGSAKYLISDRRRMADVDLMEMKITELTDMRSVEILRAELSDV